MYTSSPFGKLTLLAYKDTLRHALLSSNVRNKPKQGKEDKISPLQKMQL